MTGYLVTFYTQEHRTCQDVPVAEWLLDQARQLGIQGATLLSGKAGFGHDGRFHSAGFFDLDDHPLQVTLAVGPDECEQLFERVRASGMHIFYTRAPVEFGFTDDA